MDAGLAAIVGALIGALTAPISQYFIRRWDRRDRADERREARRSELRAAVTEVSNGFDGLLEHFRLSQARVDAVRALSRAVTVFDLLVDAEDEDLVTSLRAVVFAMNANSSMTSPEGQAAIAAAGRWTQGAAHWLRGTMTAKAVAARVQSG